MHSDDREALRVPSDEENEMVKDIRSGTNYKRAITIDLAFDQDEPEMQSRVGD